MRGAVASFVDGGKGCGGGDGVMVVVVIVKVGAEGEEL